MAHGALTLSATARRGGAGRGAGALGNAWRLAAALFACALLGSAGAQAVGTSGAEDAYVAAEEALVSALGTDLGRAPSPDDPAWRAAIVAAEGAVDAALAAQAAQPDELDDGEAAVRRAYRLEAHAYGLTNWYSRAFAAWDAYLAVGGELSSGRLVLPGPAAYALPPDADEFRRVLNQLAFARYEAGDLDEATAWYLTLLDQAPDDPEALRWLARIAYERGDVSTAVNIWQRLVTVAPDDEGARFFLLLSQERERYGVPASDAYRQGLRAYEDGDFQAALAAFAAALAANPEFVDAAVWAGRTALDLEEPAQAVRFWERAVALDPDDARSAWFLDYARVQARWGVRAGRDYYDGLTAYEAGELEAARTLFLAAADASPQFKDAFVWAARSTQELGRPDEAIGYWQTVLRLDRNDERARYFIRNARQAIVFGTPASDAFARGLEAYQTGDGPGAEAAFLAATVAAPTFLQAWEYLGRVAFQNHSYAVAAEAYAKAAELDPANEDYAFFAGEAQRLAGERPDDAP